MARKPAVTTTQHNRISDFDNIFSGFANGRAYWQIPYLPITIYVLADTVSANKSTIIVLLLADTFPNTKDKIDFLCH